MGAWPGLLPASVSSLEMFNYPKVAGMLWELCELLWAPWAWHLAGLCHCWSSGPSPACSPHSRRMDKHQEVSIPREHLPKTSSHGKVFSLETSSCAAAPAFVP